MIERKETKKTVIAILLLLINYAGFSQTKMKLNKLNNIEPIKEKVYTILLENILEGRMLPGEQLVEQTVVVEKENRSEQRCR